MVVRSHTKGTQQAGKLDSLVVGGKPGGHGAPVEVGMLVV